MKSLTVYRIVNPRPITVDDLQVGLFRPIDDTADAASIGWADHDDFLQPPGMKSFIDVGHFTRFALRIDKRTIPGAVLKKHLKVALDQEMKRIGLEGKTFISKDRKREIRDQVRLRLLARTEPKPEAFPVVIDNLAGRLFFGCARERVKEVFVGLLAQSLRLELEEITPRVLLGLEPGELDGNENEFGPKFLTSVMRRGVETPDVSVSVQGQASVDDENYSVSVAAKGSGDVQGAVKGRMTVRKARLSLDGEEKFHVTLNAADFSMTSIKLPKIDKTKDGDGILDADGVFLERMFLIGRMVKDVHDAFGQWIKITLELLEKRENETPTEKLCRLAGYANPLAYFSLSEGQREAAHAELRELEGAM